MEDLSQWFRHWHATKTYAGSWSCAQLCGDPMAIPGQGTDDDNDMGTLDVSSKYIITAVLWWVE